MLQTLQESQPDDGGDVDPHSLSREQNDKIIEGVFGPSRKGRRRFRGSGTWGSCDTPTSDQSTTSPSMQQPNESQAVSDLISRVGGILHANLTVSEFASAMPLLFGGIDLSAGLANATKQIIMGLAGKIPDHVYSYIVSDIMGYSRRQVCISINKLINKYYH